MDSDSPLESPPPLTIAIVGGGIGGIAVGLSLHAHNVPFHIYESAASFGEIGAGVTFGPNVIRAIHGISPEMLRAYSRHVTTNEPPEMLDAFLTYRRGYLPDGAAHNDHEEVPPPEKIFDLIGQVQDIDGMKFPARCSVHRAHLLDELVRLLPEGSASFGKTLVSIRENGQDEAEDPSQDAVVLSFSDGSVAAASAVIGCDGIKSVVRRHLHHGHPDATAKYSGHFGYRAMVPRADYERVLGRELAATGNVFLCPNGYTIAYPVDRGAALNMFATCVQPQSTWPPSGRAWKVPAGRDELARDLAGWHPGVLALLREHGSGEKWALFHSPHEQPYCRGRVCLVGDAAHATTPHMGAGAGMAIEDALVLGRLLGANAIRRDGGGGGGGGGDDIARVFRAYDGARRARTQAVVRESRDNVARFAAVSRARGEELERLRVESHDRFGLVFDFDLDQSLADALALLEEDGGDE